MEKPTKNFNILVADDEESLRSIISEVLVDQGYNVTTASNGQEALEKVQAGNIHVVITDIRMPEMTGIELLEKIKQFDKNVEVVIMTSFASIDTAIKAIRLGAYDYLTKPFEDLNIIPTVIDRTVGKLMLELEVKTLLAALKKKNDEIHNLYTLTTQLFNTLKLEEILKLSVTSLSQLTGGREAAFYQLNLEKRELQLLAAYPNQRTQPLPTQIALQPGDLVHQQMLNLAAQNSFREPILGTLPPEQSMLLPLNAEQRCLGVFASYSPARPFESDIRELVLQYLGNVATQAEKAILHAAVEKLAIKDGLTNLYNRRYFQNNFAHEFERARRFNKVLSIILFDVDNFKHYNDTNGHQMGDLLLKEVAQVFQTTSRTIDIVARYGGEEFIAILIETNKQGAGIRAENLRKSIESHRFPNEEKQPLGKLTVSGGFSEFPTDGNSVEELIEAADKALYEAKKAGRNRMLPAKPPQLA